MISDNIKRLRENTGLSQAALARKLGVTRAKCQRLGNGTFCTHSTVFDSPCTAISYDHRRYLGLESQEQIVLRGMNEQEKRLVYDLVAYIAERKEESTQSQK